MRYLVLFVVYVFVLGFCGNTFSDDKLSLNVQQDESQKVSAKKVSADANYDGKIDRVETYTPDGKIDMIEIDTNSDGIMDDKVIYENGKPKKEERDTNKDGNPDVWVDY